MISSQQATQRKKTISSRMGLGSKEASDPTFGKAVKIKSNYPDGMKEAKVDHSPELTIKQLARQLCHNDQKTQDMFDEIAESFPENLEDDSLKVMQASKTFEKWIEADVFHGNAPVKIQEFFERYKIDCDDYLKGVEKEKTPEGVKTRKDWFILCVKGAEKKRQAYDAVKALAKEQEQNINECGTIDPKAKKGLLTRNTQKFDQLLQHPAQQPRSIIHDYKEVVAAIHESLKASIRTQQKQAEERSDVAKEINKIPHITDKDKEDLHELTTLLDKDQSSEVINNVKGMATDNPDEPVLNRRNNVRQYLKDHDLLKVKYLSRRIKRSRQLEPYFKVNLDTFTSNIKINAADDAETRAKKMNRAKGLEKLLDNAEETIKSANSIKKFFGKSKRTNKVNKQLKDFLESKNTDAFLESLSNENLALSKGKFELTQEKFEQILKEKSQEADNDTSTQLRTETASEDQGEEKEEMKIDSPIDGGASPLSRPISVQVRSPQTPPSDSRRKLHVAIDAVDGKQADTDTQPAAQGAETAESTSAGQKKKGISFANDIESPMTMAERNARARLFLGRKQVEEVEGNQTEGNQVIRQSRRGKSRRGKSWQKPNLLTIMEVN